MQAEIALGGSGWCHPGRHDAASGDCEKAAHRRPWVSAVMKIMHAVSDIATDPSINWVQQTGRAGSAFTRGGTPVRYTVDGMRDGVKVRVVLEPSGAGIITGFPIP